MSLPPTDAATTTPVESNMTRTRPWGTVTRLEESDRYRINRIEVNPGAHISTQMHFHRTEHWVVVSGTAKVIVGGKATILRQRESTYVPMNTTHRVENPGVISLVMIEIQNGEYIGEDDIVRFPEDDAMTFETPAS
ncbi:mannose-6-phosphate isomerase [Rubidibacter lacunae KORDI 51-2]|uniref:Mannose-6-phosphate isomerase n=1 Tax=Rubidibacter lacunae KORDI 51-2 TaxID=582515 RepID=U5DJR1_9CHRO|nr:phosphomannose isomerase type II C-terminal cupin domain [Rubidibacter lacunae]ERN39925.1 mannose-6-phosphate isomerase [Rubidibacter lacunae KORDI 51-2]